MNWHLDRPGRHPPLPHPPSVTEGFRKDRLSTLSLRAERGDTASRAPPGELRIRNGTALSKEPFICLVYILFEVKGLVAQSSQTLWDPMDCSLPGVSVHRILQVRKLEWVAITFSRGSSPPRDQTLLLQGFSLPSESPGKPLYDL